MAISPSHGKASIIIGVLQLILGVVLLVCAFVFSGYGNVDSLQTRYWTGFPYLVPGVLGIIAGATKNTCCMIASLVLNIILTILTVGASIGMTLTWGEWKEVVSSYEAGRCETVGGRCVCPDTFQYDASDCRFLDSVTTGIAALSIVCYLCAALALSGSILGCAATCCATRDPHTVFVSEPTYQPNVIVSSSTTAQIDGFALAQYPQQYPEAAGYANTAPLDNTTTHDNVPLVV